MSEFSAFWLVWSPTGRTPPSMKHLSDQAARTEAERLARCHPGQEFFVLESTGMAKKTDVAWSSPVSSPPF